MFKNFSTCNRAGFFFLNNATRLYSGTTLMRRRLSSATPKIKRIDFEFLDRMVESVSSLERLRQKIKSNKSLTIKYGVDITAPSLHLGHAVNLWVLRHFQDCGHKVVFLLGDFTTKIADPTGKIETRKEISQVDIDHNADIFVRQIKKVLNTSDPSLFELRRNSEWYNEMHLTDFIGLLKLVNYNQLIKRDMFQFRIKNGYPIHLHELIYPLLQGYDSVMLKSDLTVAGTDQLFNESMGSTLQSMFGQSPQVVVTTKITPGIDGKEKQSKSRGNYIGLEDPPREMFGKTMSIPDNLITDYFKLYTDIDINDIKKMEESITQHNYNPMNAKLNLAVSIVSKYYGMSAALSEREWFEKTFTHRVTPEDIPIISINNDDFGLGIIQSCMPNKSKNECKRLIRQGAIRLMDNKITSEDELSKFQDGDVLTIGKRHWFKLNR